MIGSHNPETTFSAPEAPLPRGADDPPASGGLVLVLGGTRSGKSMYAERLAASQGGDAVLYVATAVAPLDEIQAEMRPEAREDDAHNETRDDAAMRERIRRHRLRRPPAWETLECPLRIGPALETMLEATRRQRTPLPRVVLVDCVTLWISNLLFSLEKNGHLPDAAAFEQAIRREIDALLGVIRRFPCRWVVVSGETGLGIIAPTALGRMFCDGLGLANQQLAAAAGEVRLVVAGRALALPAE